MSIFIVGTGVGDTKNLTLSAEEKIKNADMIIGSKRAVQPFENGSRRVFYEYSAEKIAQILENEKYTCAAVLFTGDASFFSGAKALSQIFPDAEIDAGISSVSYFCAKIHRSYDDANIVSTHGRKCNIVSEVRRNKKTIVLLGENPCGVLTRYGLGTVKVYIGENLSYDNEKISTGPAVDFCDTQLSPLSVMMIENDSADAAVRTGISDDEFIRGIAPMTKSSVRAVTMSKLNISPNDVCYDIGAGTGSVSVEMALSAHKGTVYAIEKNHGAAELIRKNAIKFMADNIEVVEGKAPDVFHKLPKPDKVFIGGSSGTLKQTIAQCRCDHVVVNAVTLEILNEAMSTFDELGYKCYAEQISVAYTRKVSSYNMMTAHNPVFVICAVKGDPR